MSMRARPGRLAVVFTAVGLAGACRAEAPTNSLRVSGYIEATDVRVAPEVGGRLVELLAAEGDTVTAGDIVARLDTADAELAIRRAEADRAQALAQLRLLEAGARVEDVRQARAQVAAAESEIAVARAELEAAGTDLERFESLLRAEAGSVKQRDDAATRRQVAADRVKAAEERTRVARETVARLEAGARPEEIQAARARVAAADAQIATLQKAVADATIHSPLTGIVTEKLADPGELIGRGTPVLLVADLQVPWANVFVDEPLVPRLTIGQTATVYTDAGGPGLAGTLTFVSPRAEFTPRNVQTADERAKLVYRVKVTVDNQAGVLKQGMPVEVELALTPAPAVAP
jgi:HlyD family secretion protein